MRNSSRIAAVAGAVLVTLSAGAGLAFAGDKTDDPCVLGPEQALINAPMLNCADTDVTDAVDVSDALNDVADLDDTLTDLVDDLSVLGGED
jgi:hypothetical protein